MTAKFRIGQYVKLGKRETAAVTGQALSGKYHLIERRRSRRIVRIVYDGQQECNYYFLGTNHRGKADKLSIVGFRSYQLESVTNPTLRGRPRRKRRYIKCQTEQNS